MKTLTIVTLDDALDYLTARNLELRCGSHSRGKWWAKLVMFGEHSVEGEGADLLAAIKDAVGKWEAQS